MASAFTPSPFDEAVKLICAKNVHQCLWLPQTATHERLRVTFATTSNFSDDTLPTVLFCGPMFGSRYFVIDMDHLAVTIGVRMLSVDRPGMGGSTPIALDQRIDLWLETVPILLKHLQVEHVSIISHSAGTMYAFNTIYRLRSLLDPKAPYAALIAPWVPSAHSHAALMSVATSLPAGVINSWGPTLRFVNSRVMPVTSWSGGIVSSLGTVFSSSDSNAGVESDSPAEHFGVSDDKIADQINKLHSKYKFAEDISAVNEDAKLCANKGGPESWGVCSNYETYVQDLARKERDGVAAGGAKLKVNMFFAESDVMIGEGGRKYLEQCWRQDGVADTIEFRSEVLLGTDHDSAMGDNVKGALRKVLERVKQGSQ